MTLLTTTESVFCVCRCHMTADLSPRLRLAGQVFVSLSIAIDPQEPFFTRSCFFASIFSFIYFYLLYFHNLRFSERSRLISGRLFTYNSM